MWPQQTRLKVLALASQGGAVGSIANPLVWDLPRTGILSALHLYISAVVAGTISAPNALGAASIVRRVRLMVNNGLNVIDMSGPGYHYLFRDFIDQYEDPLFYTTARNAVSAATFRLDMFFPLAINSRDDLGLVALQNQETNAQLQVELESNANIATGVTSDTVTVQPFIEVFAVPVDKEDWPPLRWAHTLVEEQQVVSGAGDVTYYWPRGNTYIRLLHGLGIAQAPADTWSRAKMRVNGADFVLDMTPQYADAVFCRYRGRSRALGVIPIDLMGYSGLGNYGAARDLFNSLAVTDCASVITATGASTLYSIKDQLVDLNPEGAPQK